MAFAQVSDGIVTQVVSNNRGLTWIPCGSLVQVGWTYSNNTFSPKLPLFYDITKWYWVVSDSISQVWSSAKVEYVATTDSDYVSWLKSGGIPSTISTESGLQAFFSQYYPAGWPLTSAEKAEIEALNTLNNNGVQISSIGSPEINGTYSTNTNSIANINAIMTYILANNAFPNGAESMAWADIAGIIHLFPNITVFKSFATSFANYVTSVSIYGNSGGTIGTIPSNQVAIP